MNRSLFAVTALAASLLAAAAPALPQTAVPAPSAAPDVTAAPSPTAAAALTSFTAQLLDLRDGFVYFTTGDAFRAAPTMTVVTEPDGKPFSGVPHVGQFARAALDGEGRVIRLAVTSRRLPTDATYAQVKKYAVVQSTVAPAPEIVGVRRTGRPVTVQFLVRVPPTTPIADSVYVTTDQSGWQPQAIKMDRVDGEHYRVQRAFASGTKFAYRYTRGSWNTVERGQDGLETDPRQFTVNEVDVLVQRDTIWRWADERSGQQQVTPDSIPTPFNPDPFGGLQIPGRTSTPGPRMPGPATPKPAQPR